MRVATVRSRCECQASLVAVLNENRHVTAAYTVDRGKEREDAPAHTMGAENERFDVGWLCTICGRNVLRSFAAGALVWTEVVTPPVNPAAAEAVAAASPLTVPATPKLGLPAVTRGSGASAEGVGLGRICEESEARARHENGVRSAGGGSVCPLKGVRRGCYGLGARRLAAAPGERPRDGPRRSLVTRVSPA